MVDDMSETMIRVRRNTDLEDEITEEDIVQCDTVLVTWKLEEVD